MEGTPKENDAAGPRLEPLFVPPGAGRGGVKAFADATGGALGLVETTIPAGHGSPLHIHNDEEEAFYVLDGAVDFICGDRGFRAATQARSSGCLGGSRTPFAVSARRNRASWCS